MKDTQSQINAIQSRINQIKDSDHFTSAEKKRLISNLETELHPLSINTLPNPIAN